METKGYNQELIHVARVWNPMHSTTSSCSRHLKTSSQAHSGLYAVFLLPENALFFLIVWNRVWYFPSLCLPSKIRKFHSQVKVFGASNGIKAEFAKAQHSVSFRPKTILVGHPSLVFTDHVSPPPQMNLNSCWYFRVGVKLKNRLSVYGVGATEMLEVNTAVHCRKT